MSFDLLLDRVEVVYPGGAIGLHGATLELRPGAFTVLLGPSGAGKSTLLRCLNHLVLPTAGRIVANGVGPLRGGQVLREHRRRTGMVFQQHHLIGRMSALRNVLTGRLGFHGAVRTLWPLPRRDREIALEALARVGLAEKALQRADRLSGGEQQRVGIARALAQRPRRILADEPVASLDPVTATRVLSLLRRVCREDGITAVVSLHQVELALGHADRIIGLAAGRVVLDAAPDALDRAAIERLYSHERPLREAPPPVPAEAAPATLVAAQESP